MTRIALLVTSIILALIGYFCGLPFYDYHTYPDVTDLFFLPWAMWLIVQGVRWIVRKRKHDL